MRKFKKLVSVDKVALIPEAIKELENYAENIELAEDIPSSDEIYERIKDADAVLISANSRLEKSVMERMDNLQYVGMCCSLYSEESANVDIAYAKNHGITVKGIRDYGDNGVTEYVIYQLVKLFHGYNTKAYDKLPREIGSLKIGFVGIGTSGFMTASALQYLGAEISYYARSLKPEKEKLGMRYMDLHELLKYNDVIITALNKNVILLRDKEFGCLGNGKIMINTSIGPASDMKALTLWLKRDNKNILCGDTIGAIGDEDLLRFPNVYCMNESAGMTNEAYYRLSKKVIDNIKDYLEK